MDDDEDDFDPDLDYCPYCDSTPCYRRQGGHCPGEFEEDDEDEGDDLEELEDYDPDDTDEDEWD